MFNPTQVTAASAVVAAPQQVPQQAPVGTAVGGGAFIALILGVLLWRAVDKKKAKAGYLVMAFTMGALLSGSIVGVMVKQTAGALNDGAEQMFSTITTNSGGTGNP